jgi:hypothetical protein
MSRRSIWLCGFTVAAAAAVSGALQTYMSMSVHGHTFGRILVWESACWAFWAAVAPLLVAQGGRFADPARRRGREWRRTIALALVLMAAHMVIYAAVLVAVQPFVPVVTYTLPAALAMALKAEWMFDILASTIPLLIGYGAVASHRAQRLALRESRLEADLARAQLDALRLEIEPHFLFNTLNSIASLIRAGSPDRALSMLVGLGDLMRATLDTPGPTTTFGDELAFVERYVALQRVRFMDRLSIHYDVDPGCEAYEVPTFLLQPLVENAFRHGIEQRAGGRIELAIERDAEVLTLSVRDDGPARPQSSEPTPQVGLASTRARLALIYADAAQLSVERVADHTVARVRLPFRTAAA